MIGVIGLNCKWRHNIELDGRILQLTNLLEYVKNQLSYVADIVWIQISKYDKKKIPCIYVYGYRITNGRAWPTQIW